MIDTYSIFFAAGSLAVLLWLGLVEPKLEHSKARISATSRIDTGLVALVLGLVGARLNYVLLHMAYYTKHPSHAYWFWEGGLSWTGGVIGVLLGVGLYSIISRTSLWTLIDVIAIPATIMAFALWFGCLLEGYGYGRRADFGLLTPNSPDVFGTMAKRWPVQGAGAIFSLIAFTILYRLQGRKLRTGMLGFLSLALISSVNLLLSFFRGDPVPYFHGFRLDALASAAFTLFGLIGFGLRSWKGT